MPTSKEGWAWPNGEAKAHWFKEGRSLCGEAGVFSLIRLDPCSLSGPDDCAVCRKKWEQQLERLEEG